MLGDFGRFLGIHGKGKVNLSPIQVTTPTPVTPGFDQIFIPGPTPTATPQALNVVPGEEMHLKQATGMGSVPGWGSQEYLITRFGEGSYYADGLYSWYDPALGGINCDTNPDGSPECDFLANGDPVGPWYGRGVACPDSVHLGWRIYIRQLDQEFVCIDRGGAIVAYNGYLWIDHLTKTPALAYWTPLDLVISPPG